MRKLVLLVATFAAFAVTPAVANAAIPEVFDGHGDITCVTAGDGTRECGNSAPRSTAKTWDGMPIDVNVAFPEEPMVGDDGPYPLVMIFHGYGGNKIGFNAMRRWTDRGYAVFSMTDRGFWQSCGKPDAIAADPTGCADQYVRLMDNRYEVRDAQYFASLLVDENLVLPERIAATGGSYGGGMSMALAALKDRTVLPDGTYVPWESPGGEGLKIAVATPNIPWTDLAYSLVPNGNTIDYVKDNPYVGRFGVKKNSYVNLLYNGGSIAGRYSPAGLQPANDLAGWIATLNAGEPYDGKPGAQAMLDEITTNHSSYYIDHSTSPSPLLISSGFTDDLFPADEATRFYNRTRSQYPNSPLSLFFGSFGHSRGQNKADTRAALEALENKWIDFYLADIGTKPESNVTAHKQTCPNPAAAGSGYEAADWASIAPGEIRLEGGRATQTVSPTGGTPAVANLFDPNGGPGGACASAPGAKEPGTANYELAAAPAGGFTMVGSPTVISKIEQGGDNSQVAARLVDVAPDNTKTLVARGLWRPNPSDALNKGFQVFQLHANGWTFEQGHVARLELLPKDDNYGRGSDGQQPATVSYIDLRLPVVEAPGALGGLVKAPQKKVLPQRAGAELAEGYQAIGSISLSDYATAALACPAGTTPPDCAPKPVIGNLIVVGSPTVKGRLLTARVKCRIGNDSCRKSTLIVKGFPRKGRKGKNLLIARGIRVVARPGQTKKVSIKITGKARKFFKDRKVRKRGRMRTVRGPKSLRSKVIVNNRFVGFKTVKRVGRVR